MNHKKLDFIHSSFSIKKGITLMPLSLLLALLFRASLVAQMVKSLPAMWETWVQSLGQEEPLRRKWQPTLVILPGKSHGWRTLAGCSPWDHRESDTTE